MSLVAPRRLSVLCITKCEPHARRFIFDMWTLVKHLPYPAELIVYCDVTTGVTDAALLRDVVGSWEIGQPNYVRLIPNTSKSGYLEAMHAAALECCQGEYILRLDDDERMNLTMIDWVYQQGFRVDYDHWKFDRAHLWLDEQHFIAQAPLWPDHQTRLSVKAKAGGRNVIHAGSPHGGGELAPGCVIEHHVFLVRTKEERQAKLDRYNEIQPGAGWPQFHLPENFNLLVQPYSTERHPDAT